MTTEAAAPDVGTTQAWRGLLAIIGEPTSDGRTFLNATWRDLPLPLSWQVENWPGHDGSVVVGRIDTIVKRGNELWGTGIIDTGQEAGTELVRQMELRMQRGVSIDAAIGDGEVTIDEEGNVTFSSVEIGGATVVAFPAFRDAGLELMSAEEQLEASLEAGAKLVRLGEVGPELVLPLSTSTGTTTSGTLVQYATLDLTSGQVTFTHATREPSWRPPAEWFADPRLERRSGLHVTDDGRIYGHLYGWGECHTGSAQGQCIQVPRGGDYRYITSVDGRGVTCSDGTVVGTGPLTISADHAELRGITWLEAKDHYAHTGLAVADVTCGEDEHGIWMAGAVRPNADPAMVEILRRHGPSGDWRMVGGHLELIAILVVNTQGFPALVASFTDGEPTALVATARAADCGCGGTHPDAGLAQILARLQSIEDHLTAPAREARVQFMAEVMEDLDNDTAARGRRMLAEIT